MLKIIVDKEYHKIVKGGGEKLKELCDLEVEKLNKYVMEYGEEYSDGLAKFERYPISAYLYHKIMGHLD